MRRVDTLVIAATTDAHALLIHQALDAGLPTFCEKPIALDLRTTDDVIEHVHEVGVPLQIGFQRRFDSGYREARRLVERGALGQLYVVRAATHDTEPPNESFIATSGGLFSDLQIHDLDAIRFVTGQEVLEVMVYGDVLAFDAFARNDDIDTAVTVMRLSSGTLVILSGTRHSPGGYDVRLELCGSSESVVVGWDQRTPIRSLELAPQTPPQPCRNFIDRFGSAYVAELDDFLRVAQDGKAPGCSAEDAREALRIALACSISCREKRSVQVAALNRG